MEVLRRSLNAVSADKKKPVNADLKTYLRAVQQSPASAW